MPNEDNKNENKDNTIIGAIPNVEKGTMQEVHIHLAPEVMTDKEKLLDANAILRYAIAQAEKNVLLTWGPIILCIGLLLGIIFANLR